MAVWPKLLRFVTVISVIASTNLVTARNEAVSLDTGEIRDGNSQNFARSLRSSR